jgi:hypothetical protein
VSATLHCGNYSLLESGNAPGGFIGTGVISRFTTRLGEEFIAAPAFVKVNVSTGRAPPVADHRH